MDIVESAKFDINICFTCTFSFFGIFFMDPDRDFSWTDPDFWPIWIRTQEKKSDPDPKQCSFTVCTLNTVSIPARNNRFSDHNTQCTIHSMPLARIIIKCKLLGLFSVNLMSWLNFLTFSFSSLSLSLSPYYWQDCHIIYILYITLFRLIPKIQYIICLFRFFILILTYYSLY